MKAILHNQQGEKVKDLELPKDVFGLAWNNDLIHQVTIALGANRRSLIAHTKCRGEVSGSGKKPWKQKGTGRARHGSIRSPIWRGGGVTHGPTNEKIYTQKINKKMKEKALFTLLSRKLKDNEILFLDKIVLSQPKTKEAVEIISSLSKIKGFEKISSKKNAAVIALPKSDQTIKRSFSNLPGINIFEARNLNLLEILSYKYLILAEPEKTLAKK